MARKRRNSSSSELEDVPSPKRPRPFSIDESDLDFEPTGAEEPKVNATYGQKRAFPGLEDGDDGTELFYGPASNGLEYLRMVRSEAKGVPLVLVGPDRTSHLNGSNDYHKEGEERGEGYYEDGAFIAAPGPTANLAVSGGTLSNAQKAYYTSLVSRFRKLRLSLQQTPPLSAIEALTSDHSTSLPPDSDHARQQWRFQFQNQAPRMAQLACMDIETVLEVVKLFKGVLAGTVRSRSQERIERLGAWIWGVLGKCNEAGLLGSEEVSELRELGKRAVGLLVGIRDRSGKDYGRQEDEAEGRTALENNHEVNGGNSAASQTESIEGMKATNLAALDVQQQSEISPNMEEFEHAKAILLDQLSTGGHCLQDGAQAEENEAEEGEVEEGGEVENVQISMDRQVRVILDMIITIVGELYGQRDLLEFRDVWDDEIAGSSGQGAVQGDAL